MAQTKLWCWELALKEHGPDWRLHAYVTPSSESALARIVETTMFDNYTICPDNQAYCTIHQQQCTFHSWMDDLNAEIYIANLTTSTQQNIWVYDFVCMHRDCIEIECGYGGHGDAYQAVVTNWLIQLFMHPSIILRAWEVRAGGNGYDFHIIQEGQDARSFIAYLAE